jgi:hypothetical protein
LTPNIDKQEMRNYLLGSLEAERRATLEESILCDPGVYEELLVLEEELIDQYITNNLSPSERQRFETNFLVTAERQNKLRFGRLLRRYLDSSQPVYVPPDDIPVTTVRHDEIHAPATKFFSFAAGKSATLAVSTAVVVSFIILALVCWCITRKPEQHTVQDDSSRYVRVALTPGSMRSEGGLTTHVPVQPKDVNIRLELQVTNPNYRNYKSELFRESRILLTAEKLKAETTAEQQQVVPLTVAADVLSPGDYKVTLSGVVDLGPDEFIDNYSFRVVKK